MVAETKKWTRRFDHDQEMIEPSRPIPQDVQNSTFKWANNLNPFHEILSMQAYSYEDKNFLA